MFGERDLSYEDDTTGGAGKDVDRVRDYIVEVSDRRKSSPIIHIRLSSR